MILDAGLIDYKACRTLQGEIVRRRKQDKAGDTLIFAEHKSIFTVGRLGYKGSLITGEAALERRGLKIIAVDRGGGITYHGPGQLVIYPIIRLNGPSRDLHKYMRRLEDAAIAFFGRYSVSASREAGRTGAWVSGRKVASIGIGVSGWVTYHGLSLNISNDLGYFDMIHPCGLAGVKAASLASVTGKEIPMDEAKRAASEIFGDLLGAGRVRSLCGGCLR